MQTIRMRVMHRRSAAGGLVTWTYVVTNTGNEPLNNVVVTDDQGVALSLSAQPAVLNPGDVYDLHGLRFGR